MSTDFSVKELPRDRLLEAFRQAPVSPGGVVYRSVPFWSWNGDLDPQELRRQVREFKAQGLGGFFMHGRVGLVTPYLGQRWMECVEASIEEAAAAGMKAWLYDENGFPSGGAGGEVAAQGSEYCRVTLGFTEHTPPDFRWSATTVAAFVLHREGGSCRVSRELRPGELAGAALEGARGHTTVLEFFITTDGYVDVLSRKAVRKFIDLTYERYQKVLGGKLGREVPGIFTDEPSYGLLPWSLELPDSFRRSKGYEVTDVLPGLILKVEGWRKARYDYWSVVSEMFVGAYSEQIGSWCREHGIALTGHVAWAETLMGQMTFHAASMPFYEFMEIPGTNHLGVRLMDAMREKQVASVARQMGDRRVLSEVAGGMGWGVSFEEVKWVTEWQIVLGVSLLCQHLHHYTLRGETKRDIPPSYSYQQPWWGRYGILTDYFTRLTFLLTRGRRDAEILLLHPIGSAWILFDGKAVTGGIDTRGGPELVAYNDRQNEICNALLSIHRDFDYGDERIISRRGRVEGGSLIVGEAGYRLVILPELLTIRRSTLDLLARFIAGGGKVACLGEPPALLDGAPSKEPAGLLQGCARIDLPPWPEDYQKPGRFEQPASWEGTRRALKDGLDPVLSPSLEIATESEAEADRIWCLQRSFEDGRRILFLVNLEKDKGFEVTVRLPREGGVEEWDAGAGTTRPLPVRSDNGKLSVDLSFQPMQSHLLVIDPTASPVSIAPRPSQPHRSIELSGSWVLETSEPNALTIDWCRFAVDGAPLSERLPTLKAWHEARRLSAPDSGSQRQLVVEYEFHVDPDAAIDRSSMTLVIEDPQRYAITVNDTVVDATDTGWWRDIAFRKVPIGKLARRGRNTVRLVGRLDGGTVDSRTEIESVYMTGDFGVRSLSPVMPSDRRTVLTDGPFAICRKPGAIPSGNLDGGTDIASSGYWFYAGNVRLTQSFELPADYTGSSSRVASTGGAWLELDPPDSALARVLVNGREAETKGWRPFRFEVGRLLKPDRNTITIELFGTLRNLLGPHHHWRGEVLYTGTAFNLARSPDEDEPGVPESTWVDRYCFRRFGLSSVPVLRF